MIIMNNERNDDAIIEITVIELRHCFVINLNYLLIMNEEYFFYLMELLATAKYKLLLQYKI